MGSDTSKISVNQTPQAIRLPRQFHLYYDRSWGLKFVLGVDKRSALYSAALPNSWYGDLIVYNGPTTDYPALAKCRNSGSLGNHTKVTLPPLGDGRGPLEEEMRNNTSLTTEKHTFSIFAGNGPQQFEWRHTGGHELESLGGASRGWKLVWLNRQGREETVAIWADAAIFSGEATRAASFGFINTGATGEFGDVWALMAVVTFLRLWQKKMQTTMTSGAAAGVTAGVVAGM